MVIPRTHLVISTNADLLRINIRQILYFKSDGNYCTLFLVGGEIRMIAYQLGQVEKMIAEQLPELSNTFVRIGRSYIVNLHYVYYINPSKQLLLLSDTQQGRYTLNASRDALVALKEAIESKL